MSQIPLDVTLDGVKIFDVPYEMQADTKKGAIVVVAEDTKRQIAALVDMCKSMGITEYNYREEKEAEGN